MAELSQSTQKLVQRYQEWHQSLQQKEEATTIHVDEVAARVAAFYEKIRGVVDWREEHLMRRVAIERILKRRLFLNNSGEEIAAPLVLELIRGGHCPNDRIEESKIEEVKKLLDKYIFIIENSPSPPINETKFQLEDRILNIAACEIEEVLCPSLREMAQIEYMAEEMREKIEIKGAKIPDEEKSTQVYVATQEALLKLDLPIISYNLLKKWYPSWRALTADDIQLQEITKNIYLILENIDKAFNHPLAGKFYKTCERYDTAYLILGDIISENPNEAVQNLKNPEVVESKIKDYYQKRLKVLRGRVKRAAIYVTLSIFVTKMLLAFAIEVPFDKYLTNQFNNFTLILNILIPPLLMFFLVLTIRPPKKENLQQVIMETMKIIYQREKKDIYQIKLPQKRGWLMNFIIIIFYFLTFFLSYGLIIWSLNKLNFGALSIIIFLVYVSLISFAGMKIRERARELEAMEIKETIWTAFFDLLSVPIIRVGKWLSGQWLKFNVVVILINFLIDLPFQSVVAFIEQWRAFAREKKEEIH